MLPVLIAKVARAILMRLQHTLMLSSLLNTRAFLKAEYNMSDTELEFKQDSFPPIVNMLLQTDAPFTYFLTWFTYIYIGVLYLSL